LAVAELHNSDPKLEDILSASAGISQNLEFSAELDFSLTRKEARYLTERFDASAEANGCSLMAHLLGKSVVAD